MPFLSGSMSFREYRVEGALPPNYRKVFEEGFERYKFRPPQAARLETRSMGWVNPRRLLDEELNFGKLLIADYLFFAMRVDRISINPKLYKARLGERLAAKAKELNKKRLAKAERDLIAETLKREMLEETTPSTSLYEIVWNPESKRLFFSSSSEKLNEDFMGLFEDSFDMTLCPLYTYFRARDWAESNGREDVLEAMTPSGGLL